MIPVVSVGALKTAGTSTMALTLAAVTAAAEIPTIVVDAARDGDLSTWAERGDLPALMRVVRCREPDAIERHVRAARRRGDAAIIDAGDDETILTAAARLADRAVVPVRFSPLSAYAAIVTDQMLARDMAAGGRPGRDRVFAASAVTAIPSRVARAVDAMISASPTPRLSVGLSQRAAYEAPFLAGGTLFTLSDDAAPGLDRARAEAASFAHAVGLLGVVEAAEPRDETPAPATVPARVAA